MAKPKGKLFALLAIFAAIGLATATGAFTTVQADRTANINAAGDSAALLQLTPASEYAQSNNNQLQLDFAGSSGAGVNTEAITDLGRSVFVVENQGSQTVSVSVTAAVGSNDPGANGFETGQRVLFYVHESELEGNPDVSTTPDEYRLLSEIADAGNINTASSTDAGEYVVIDGVNAGSRVALEPGASVNVGVYVDAMDVTQTGDLVSSVTVSADANETYARKAA